MNPVSHGKTYKGVGDTLVGIYKHEGFSAYWKGNYTNCIRIIPTCALKFTFFDSLKLWMLPQDHKFTGLDLFWRKVAAGGMSGVGVLMCVYPLEVVRTRLTANQERHTKNFKFKGMKDCFQKTVKHEGPQALYKGLGPSLFGIVPYFGIMFSTHDTLKDLVPKGPDGRHSTLTSLVMGGISGVIAQTLVFPVDTVRNRMQVDGLLQKENRRYKNAFHCFKSIYTTEGYRAFYRGVSTNMYKGFIGIAIEFHVYEHGKAMFFKFAGQTDRADKI
eukprot:CAMPEP_0201530308 /NCGR_PEP_ID=MMETSP0161_2-20130828/44300_1 /ASSEMBLY_ACC=CAM_ASM_000251 /TAXON_ID=180227 /ORGANISM="Neoparamoeba aestuarina, Strain SoJaBio B1-5/56/2" /LENGTH=272 /DNA_ID=CAMNT_0047932605 /DNA_START=95 /DNA_END=913 /DNA_ORIENTATION=+